MQNENTQYLKQLKRNLGPILHLDFTAFDGVTAHTKLGMEVQEQVYSILTRKLAKLSQAELIDQLRIARASKSAIDARISAGRLDNLIRSAFAEYIDCISGWALGAQLNHFRHEKLDNLLVDGTLVSGEDLAYFLQSEATGCQTGIIRAVDGSIIMWHTEEDAEPATENRFDKLRIFSFRYKDKKQISAFIYPDLLPGPAFGWSSDGFVQAIDTLYARPYQSQAALASNTVAWIRLCIGRELGSQELMEAIRPFQTGCAIVTITQMEDKIDGQRLEFAGNQWMDAILPEEPGSFLFQVNLFSARGSEFALNNESVPPGKQAALLRRISRTRRAITRIGNSGEKAASLLRLLASRTGGEYAYCNKDVKVHLICQASHQAISKMIGAGPAFVREELWTFS